LLTTALASQQFAWLEKDYPLLFQRIKAAVAKGQFTPNGGAWVEADVQISSGEALCRQFLYGQRFFKSRFGSYTRTFWLPDSFGYSSALPQIIRLAGMDSFVTQKLSWSQFNTFPHSTFMWAGQDGTQILAHFPPADTYTAQASVAEIRKAHQNNKSLAACETSLLAYGNGDGGGGPLAFMLENLRRVRAAANKSGELPKVTAGQSVPDFFDDVLERTDGGKALATWTGELYLELHRGTLTSHGIIKKYNRKCEILLREVEFASTLAAAVPGGAFAYPKDDLDALWQK
jgi:alpha-mannosidase